MDSSTTSDEQGKAVGIPERLRARQALWRIPVRMKLATILALPLALLLVLGASRVLDVQRSARDARREAELAEVIVGPSGLLNALMDERNETSVYLLNLYDFYDIVEEGGYLELREVTDAAATEFLDLVQDDGEIQEIYQPAIDALEELGQIRADIDEVPEEERTLDNIASSEEYFGTMAEIIDPIFDANAQLRTSITHGELQRGVVLVDRANRQLNTAILLIQDVSLLALLDQRGADEATEYLGIGGRYEQLEAGDEEIRLYSDGPYEDHVHALFTSEWHPRLYETIDSAIETGTPDINDVFTIMDPDFADYMYKDLQEDAERTILAEADRITGDAAQARQVFVLASVLVLLLVGALTARVALSITRPLRKLVEQATTMCEERLPRAIQSILETPLGENVAVPALDPVQVSTRDEVAEVADALTSVQKSAVELAVEQAALRRNIADSYVNLGRRNQSLVGRQLDFITELEKSEADPDALANLFKLDHLATRMRRNAESLLVLAGIEPPRTWSSSVRLTDVVRASLGEIEDYQRVGVRGIEPATIVGSAAADLAHLLAELIENALTFSPPDRPVEIHGRWTPVTTTPPLGGSHDIGDGNGGYTLVIVDSGLGMTPEDIERANRRLAGKESVTIAPSKYLGHYVAGMIAARRGIHVQLRSSPPRGVAATLVLPPELLSSQEAAVISTPADLTARDTNLPATLGDGSDGSDGSASPFGPRPTATPAVDLTGPAVASPAYQEPGVPLPPTTYRIGEAEYTIDVGIATPALSAGEDEDRNQLIHRIQGAQMPRTEPRVLSAGAQADAGEGPNPPAPPSTEPGGADPGATSDENRAGNVRNVLSRFSSGLEQGREAAARELEDPTETDADH